MGQHAGMGAIPFEGGVAFRVWAPHADSVAVVGDFNNWDAGATAMERGDNGYWYAETSAKLGQEYKYELKNGDQTFQRIDPYARQVTNSVGNGIIYDHGQFDWGNDQPGLHSLDDLVIYELHVGSFNAEQGRGSFESVAARLDYLKSLGVNAIELMPVMEFAGDDSWGYNPAHLFAVESTLGGPDGLKQLVRQAHERGIAVIVDVVYNHFGPSDLPTWQFDGWSESDDKGGIYFYNDDRSSTPWGDTRPDYGREEVRAFIRDNAVMWLRDFHADGLRFDMTPYIRSKDGSGMDIPEGWALMREVNSVVREHFPDRLLIAEDMQQNPAVSYTGDGGAAFHFQWDGAFVHPVREALKAENDDHRSLEALAGAILKKYNDNAFERVIYTESHDEVANGKARVPLEVAPDDTSGELAQKLATLGAATLLTSPGIPMLFMGQEFLQDGWFQDTVPLDWSLTEKVPGVLGIWRDLIALRRNATGRSRGLQGQHTEIVHADDDATVIGYHRWAEGGTNDSVFVVLNFSGEARTDLPVGFPAAGNWELLLNTDAPGYSDEYGSVDSHSVTAEGDQAAARINVGPYTGLIFGLTD
ncbi:alpha amylase C-terminal domain-containing protein [Yimella sp. cx-573]|nr:alpha amylase C-terminal domain-containing protein [Yimella sp. cx-573]